jgi:C2 domain
MDGQPPSTEHSSHQNLPGYRSPGSSVFQNAGIKYVKPAVCSLLHSWIRQCLPQRSDRNHRGTFKLLCHWYVLESGLWRPNQQIAPQSVVRAHDLPRLKNPVGKKRKFFVTVSNGTTTKRTVAIRSEGQAVHWNETLGALWVHAPLYSVTLTQDCCSAYPSSHLTLCIYAKKSIGKDIFAGTLEIPFDSFYFSSQSGLSRPLYILIRLANHP